MLSEMQTEAVVEENKLIEDGLNGEREKIGVRNVGPGLNNLSPEDIYAEYQWGLKNDGQFQYQELINRFQDSNPKLAAAIDLANVLGIPLDVGGPGIYSIETTDSVAGVDINIQPAWELYDQSEKEHRPVIVAVIDTGVDIYHPELKDAIWVNEDEIPDDGIDNDGNGYVDDVYGWNFFSNNNQIYVGKEDDHGTHAAGTIAAARKYMGIAGITDNRYVKIMVLKVLGTENGIGEEDAIIQAIEYAESNGASICNLSFGTEYYLPRLEQVMRDSNMLFISAAGNGGESGEGVNSDQNPDYPAAFDLENNISVANLMFDGNLAKSSNYSANIVDIAAPGTYIVSTTTDNSYGFMTGTSMAAPMVTGVAAMLYSYRTDITLSEVKGILINSARPLDGLKGKLVSGGVVDAYAALTYERH
ncbi:peptidase S8 [Clostridiaceae bacterium]|nr:peptidase S8 [Clostridiaceae bacterium]